MVHAILLAAGRSRRMGSQKLLLPFAGSTVIAHIAAQIARSRVGRTVAVLGADADRVAAALTGFDFDLAVNPDPAGDMLSSVRCGLRALPEQRGGGVLIALGDQPGVSTELIDRMIDAFQARPGGIVVPVHQGKRGHPILFSTSYRGEVLTGLDGVGLRGLPGAHGPEVVELSTDDPSVLSDMDRPADYRRELRRGEFGC